MSLLSRISSAVRWLAIGKACSQVVSWLLTVVTVRLLTPEDYGLLTLSMVVYSFAILFQELGLRLRIVQMRDLDLELVRAIYGVSLLFNLALAALVAMSAPVTAWFFGDDRLTPIVLALSGTIVIGAIATVPDALRVRDMDFRTLTVMDLIITILSSILTLSLAYLGFGVWALVAGMSFTSIVRAATLILLQPKIVTPTLRLDAIRETLQFGAVMVGQRFTWMAFSSLDRILLGRMYDPAVTGAYAVASELASLPLTKLSAIVQLTTFTGLARTTHDKEMFKRYLLKGMSLVGLIAFPVCFGLSAVSREIAPLLLGQKWTGVGEIMMILALVMPFRLINGPLLESLNAWGQPGLALKTTITLAIIVSGAISVGIFWGPKGVALAWLAGYLIGLVVTASVVARTYGLTSITILRVGAESLIGAAVMLLIVVMVRPMMGLPFPSVAGVLSSVALGIAIYGAITFLTARTQLVLLWESLSRR